MPPTTTPQELLEQSIPSSPGPSGTPGFDDGLDFLAVSKDAPAVKSLAFVRWVPVPTAANAPTTTEVAAPRSVITAALCLGATALLTRVTSKKYGSLLFCKSSLYCT